MSFYLISIYFQSILGAVLPTELPYGDFFLNFFKSVSSVSVVCLCSVIMTVSFAKEGHGVVKPKAAEKLSEYKKSKSWSKAAKNSKQNNVKANQQLKKTPAKQLAKNAKKAFKKIITAVQASSKSYKGIIARVNGSIITQRDLDEVVGLSEFLSGTRVDKTQKTEFANEVLREKIHEILEEENVAKIRAMLARNGQKVDFAPAADVKESYESIAKKHKMTPDQLEQTLKRIGVKKATLIRKIRTEIAWNSYIRGRYGRDVAISDKSAKKAEQEVLAKMNQEAYFVGRIFLPVFSESGEASVRVHANNIMNMINRGASFLNLARQFSKGVEASKGGIIGWVFDGTMSDPETNALKTMSIGSCKMVRTDRGFSILLLQDKKAPGPQTYTTLRFRQVICPFQHGRPPKEALDQLLAFVDEMKRSSKNCRDFIRRAQESGIMGATGETSAVLEQMLPEYRKSIEGVAAGTVSQPIITDEAVIMICMLEKQKHTIRLPTKEEIVSQKIGEKLMSLSERELKGLLRKASIYTDPSYRLGADYSSSKR